MRDM